MLNLLEQLVKGKAAGIAKVTGKSEAEINAAIEQGKKYLPQLKNSSDGGVGLIKSLGIDRAFIDDMYNKYGHYADRVPFIGRAVLDREYSKLVNNFDKPVQGREQRRTGQPSKNSKFDLGKYKKF